MLFIQPGGGGERELPAQVGLPSSAWRYSMQSMRFGHNLTPNWEGPRAKSQRACRENDELGRLTEARVTRHKGENASCGTFCLRVHLRLRCELRTTSALCPRARSARFLATSFWLVVFVWVGIPAECRIQFPNAVPCPI